MKLVHGNAGGDKCKAALNAFLWLNMYECILGRQIKDSFEKNEYLGSTFRRVANGGRHAKIIIKMQKKKGAHPKIALCDTLMTHLLVPRDLMSNK